MSRSSNDPLQNLQREVERLFHDLVYSRHPTCHFSESLWSPPADLVVTEQSARVLIELAGVARENVRVRILGRTLEISGRREPPREPAGAHYHRAEIFFGSFHRAVELPWEADESSIDARYSEGMLEIRVAAAPAPKLTHITVEPHASE